MSKVLAISLIIPRLVGVKLDLTLSAVDIVSVSEFHSNPRAFGCKESEQSEHF